jgi:type II secretory pathway predicted ATPase ExeA
VSCPAFKFVAAPADTIDKAAPAGARPRGIHAMYESHFGLRRRPFRPTPDTEGYYPATCHERALAQLLQALADGEGLALVTGEPGTGKTLLGQCLLERLGSDITSAFLTNSHFGNRTGLLQAILYDLSLPYEARAEQELRLALTDFLLQNYAADRRAVLVVDEAHHLSADLLEELRLLGNLEAPGGKALQVVLLGQPSILPTLGQPELVGLCQRLAARARVEPLGTDEAADYLLHQVRAAGGRPGTLFTAEALELLARGGQGVPRLLNQAAHRALTLACESGATQVDAEAALEALTLLGLEVEAGTLDTTGPAAQEAVPGPAPTESSDDENSLRFPSAALTPGRSGKPA